MSNRFPSKLSALKFLKEHGLAVGTVIDVGVHHKTAELIEVFPDVKHLLFEPVEEFFNPIKQNYSGIDFELITAALSNEVGTTVLEVRKLDSEHVTHSQINEASTSVHTRQIEKTTLDHFLQGKDYAKPYLLKIDVDGHEIPILEGAEETLKEVSCVIIEAPLPHKLFERLSYLVNRGLQLWDMVDFCYYRGNLSQMDLIFLSKTEKTKPNFSPWQHFEFKRENWQVF